jgi:hypothetical protein
MSISHDALEWQNTMQRPPTKDFNFARNFGLPNGLPN